MFVIRPQAQCVLSVWGKRYQYFPVNAIYGCSGNFPQTGPFSFHARSLSTIFGLPEKGVGQVPCGALQGCRASVHLAIAIGKDSEQLMPEDALGAVWGWSVAVSLIKDELSAQAGAGAALNLPGSLIMAPLRPVARALDPVRSDMWLYVDNRKEQSANTAQMIRPIADLVSLSSHCWGLKAGDIILSGSTASAASVGRGSQIEAGIGGIGTVRFALV